MVQQKAGWKRNRLWTRLGPTALALAVAGIGVGSVARSVHAENLPVTATEDFVLAQEQANAAGAEEKEKPNKQEQESLRKELEGLMRQRAQMDERIARLQNRLGERPRAFVFRQGRELTPDQRKAADEAMRMAREAMRQAQEAMREAMRALPEGERGRVFVMPDIKAVPIPKIAVPPVPEFRFFTPGEGKDGKFFFFRDGKKLEGKDAELFGAEMEKWAREWAKEWEKQRPEFDKQMRLFSERMQKWQRDFDTRLRQKLEEKGRKEKEAPKKEAPEAEEPEVTEVEVPDATPNSKDAL